MDRRGGYPRIFWVAQGCLELRNLARACLARCCIRKTESGEGSVSYRVEVMDLRNGSRIKSKITSQGDPSRGSGAVNPSGANVDGGLMEARGAVRR